MTIDDRARAAAADLRAHVDQRVDPAAALDDVTARRPRHARGRLVLGGLLTLIAVGAIAVLAIVRPDDHVRVDADQSHTSTTVVQIPAKPDDGLDSIGLPITVEPKELLSDGQAVTVTGTGFVPGEQVGVVMCVKQADAVNRGADGCDLGLLAYALADAQGTATTTFSVHRLISTTHDGVVDCGETPGRCSIGMGALQNYDRSGGTVISFDASQPPPDIPAIAVSPGSGLGDGQTVTVTGSSFPPGSEVGVELCLTGASPCFPLAGSARADDTGHLELSVVLWRYISGGPSMGGFVDCAGYPGECVLIASQPTGGPGAQPVGLTFDPALPARSIPTAQVNPVVDLTDGATVAVAGSGFVGQTVTVYECNGFTLLMCMPLATGVVLDPDGSVTVDVVVQRMFPGAGGSIDCAATAGSCVLAVMEDGGTGANDPPPLVTSGAELTFRA